MSEQNGLQYMYVKSFRSAPHAQFRSIAAPVQRSQLLLCSGPLISYSSVSHTTSTTSVHSSYLILSTSIK